MCCLLPPLYPPPFPGGIDKVPITHEGGPQVVEREFELSNLA